MRDRLASRLLIGSASLAVLVAIAFGLLIATIDQQRDALGEAVDAESLVSMANDVERQVVDLETGQRGFLVTGAPRFLEPFERARRDLPGKLQRLRTASASNPVASAEVERIQRGVDAYLTGYALPLVATGRRNLERARARVATGEGKRRMDALRRRFDVLADAATAVAAQRRRDADDNATEATAVGVACTLGSVLLIVLFGLYLTRAIARPLRHVAGAARAVAAGDLSARATDAEDAPAELGAMARAFDHMADSLEQGRDELESQNAELERQQAEIERALTDLEEEKERIDVLHGFGELLAQETDPETLAERLLRRLADLVDAEVGAIHLVDAELTTLRLAATRGLAPSALERTVGPGAGLGWRALRERRLVTASHADAALELELLGGRVRVVHELHLPLVRGQGAIAVVSLARSADRPFARSELALLERLGEQAAVAMANALATEAVHEAAAFNRAVLDGAQEAFVSMDARGRISAWNRRAEELFGWSRAEALGRSLFETILPERLRAAAEAGLQGYLADGSWDVLGRSIETQARHRDGHEFPVGFSATPTTARGELSFNAFVRDISDRKRAEAALRLQLERFAAVLRAARGYAIISTDPDGVITVFNEGAERMLGYRAEELVQRETPALFHDADEIAERARELGVAPGFGVFVHDASLSVGGAREWTYVRKDGSRLPVRLTLSALRGEGGEALGFMGIAEDVTEQRDVERRRAVLLAGTRALAEASDERDALARLLEALVQGLGWEAGLYWSVEEGVLRCREAWSPDASELERLRARDGELAQSVRASGVPIWVQRAPGDPLPGAAAVPLSYDGDVCGVLELRAASPRQSNERELDLLVTLASQTGHYLERKRAEREAERLKDEFFALVSHELRTPLTSIVGYVETLAELEAEQLSDDGQHFLGVVSRNAAQLQRLVDDLLLMAQIDAGKLSLQRGEVDLAQIAADSVDAARPRADANAVELRLHGEQLPELHGDAGRLRQALDNLVSNAIKFSPQGGVVEVALDARPHELTIAVSDTGVGIPEADQQQLFTRFFRASTAEHIGGVGLGLTIVKAIAEGHGGDISVESEEGEGTTFTLELPRNGSRNGKEAPR